MLDEVSPDTVILRLQHTLAQAELTPSARAQAQDLYDRLSSGVRVVVAGPAQAGKSQLCEVLLGVGVSDPPDHGAGAVQYLSPCAGLGPVAKGVRSVVLDSPLLETTTLIDVMASSDQAEWPERCRSALDDADIVLWCSEAFTAEEAALWSQAPDHLKDHSCLVLTKADLLAAEGVMETRIERMQAVAAEEFHSFFPTSTSHIQARLRGGQTVDDAALAASGVKALREKLLHIAASGRRADLDQAMLFLEQYGLDAGCAATLTTDAASGDLRTKTTYHEALELLRVRVPQLLSGHSDESTACTVLSACGALVEELAELAADQSDTDDAFDLWRNDLYEASDKVVLMGLENDMRSAADAASVVLQLKDDLEHRIAC